ADLAAELERRRAALGALAERTDDGGEAIAAGIESLGESVAAASEGLASARDAADDAARADAIGVVRAASERSARTAGRGGELQGRLRAIAEKVTEAEESAAQERERREDARAELDRLASILGREVAPADALLTEVEREEVERGLERVSRRREALGPVNPLAEREYEDAVAHVSALAEQREDLESALA